MNRTYKVLNASFIVIALALSLPVRANEAPQEAFSAAASTRVPSAALWRDRSNIESLNLLYGAGGKEHQPTGKFTFVKEDKQGTAPKFEILDEQGVRWKVKLGEESKSETAATRLVWAAGYYTDEDYYLPELRVEKMPRLDRGRQFVSADGVVRSVRLERRVKGQKKSGNWSWFNNPFVGTRELNGLRIMMALINNWDLKEHVDFFLSSRPFILSVFNAPNYAKRTHMQDIVKEIPLVDAKWLGKLLEPLSDEQIRDCFRAAGYSSEEVEENAAMIKERIRDLNRL